ncbi:hypothetical protein B0H16DRAFT_1413007 [Mycena metata]|uniref:DUF4185 domain-containing protein n=1 Tax=Mycena metata TaxID=1033252 RepID=A0AAD7JJM2_9AGAR|nr:hypothetical protein B0H16DRAFT_1413007 [Mycena metata]
MSPLPLRSAFVLFACGTAFAASLEARTTITPTVAKVTEYGNLIDPGLNRDSCSSTYWAPNKVLWVCRDTQQAFKNGTIGAVLVANTVSYSTMPSPPSDPNPLLLHTPQGYGPLFYPFNADECPAPTGCGEGVCGAGFCADGTRWVGWPDTTPVVTLRAPLGVVNAYGWMAQQRLTGLEVLNQTGWTLYHVTSGIDLLGNSIPKAVSQIESFWKVDQIGYGTAANLVHDGYAYLYGATPGRRLALARAPLIGAIPSLEDHSIYEYWVNGKWTHTAPVSSDPTIVLENTSAIQGTIYYSPKWKSFVSIGGDGFPDANFIISTAPNPEGPWSTPVQFYSGSIGNGTLPAYSAIAHPGMTDGTGDYIMLTWTKTFLYPGGEFNVYEAPLIRVDWK